MLGGIGSASFERAEGGLFGTRFAFTRSGRFGGRLELSVLREDTLGDATHVIATAGLLVAFGG